MHIIIWTTLDAEALRRDLRNGPYHVFGDHSRCSVTFCKVKQAAEVADCEIIRTSVTETSEERKKMLQQNL